MTITNMYIILLMTWEKIMIYSQVIALEWLQIKQNLLQLPILFYKILFHTFN